MTGQPAAEGALAGLKVVDFTHALAGPYCTMLLADLGAEVIKIEPPWGDSTRNMGPYTADDDQHAFGGYFNSVNRNKLSISLDLSKPEALEVARRLIGDADILVENFRAGVMDRMGLSFEAIHGWHPKLVYAAIRGFGDSRTGRQDLPEGRYSEWPAFDVVAQALGGLMAITGPAGGPPMNAGAPVGDIVPALFMALGIVSAVRHAERTGRGQFVDVAMYDAVLALCERTIYQNSYLGEVPGPQGASNPQICPFDAFPASDGWVTIAAPGERHWQLLCDLIGRPELGEDARYSINAERVRRADEVRAIIGDWTSVRTKAEVVDELGGLVPCGPVNTIVDILADPHIARREMIATVEQPGSARPVQIAGAPIKMTETPATVRRRGPLLGEHTDEVLFRLNYAAAEIAKLRNAGIVS